MVGSWTARPNCPPCRESHRPAYQPAPKSRSLHFSNISVPRVSTSRSDMRAVTNNGIQAREAIHLRNESVITAGLLYFRPHNIPLVMQIDLAVRRSGARGLSRSKGNQDCRTNNSRSSERTAHLGKFHEYTPLIFQFNKFPDCKICTLETTISRTPNRLG